MANAPSKANGALTQGLRVASTRAKIIPSPPNAVIKAVIVVGLNGESPGTPAS